MLRKYERRYGFAAKLSPHGYPYHCSRAYHGIGLSLLAGILKKLRTAGIHHDWNTIRNILATHARVTTTMNTEDGHVIDVRTCTTPTEKQHMIYNKLHIKHAPLGRKYIKSSMKTQRCSAKK